MADYTINVDVDVKDSDLDSLETKINNLDNKDITLNVKTNLSNIKSLSKDIKTAVEAAERSIGQSYKKGKNSLFQDLFDPGKVDTKSISDTVKNINKLIGKDLNFGEVQLSVNKDIYNDLNSLENKLREIKTLANSMGSIKLDISDNIGVKDGKIVVGESSSTTSKQPTFTQRMRQLDQIAKAKAYAEQQLSLGNDEGYFNDVIKQLNKEKDEVFSAIKEMKDVSKSVNATEAFAKSTEKYNKQYKDQLTQIANGNSLFEKEYEKAKSNYEKFSSYQKLAGNTNSPLDKELNNSYGEWLNKYRSNLKNIEEIRTKLRGLDSENDREQIVSLNSEMSAYLSEAKRQAKYLNNYQDFVSKSDTKYRRTKSIGIDLDKSSEKVQDSMKGMVEELARGKKYTTSYNAETGKMLATIERGSGIMEKYTLKYKEGPGTIESSLSKITSEVKPFSSYISELGSKFKTLSQYLVSNFGFEALQTGIVSGVSAIRELDTAMTELKKTSEGTKQQYRDFTSQANKDAKAIGSTTVQITQSAADWTRLGYSLNDASTMAKQTGILKNVSEFETIDDATTSLVGIMQAYHINAKDSSALIDQLNKIGNNYSISTSGLAEALQISGSMLEVAGNTKEQSMAIVTAMNSSIQNPSQAARAARTVAMRLTGVDSETLQAEGEDIDGLIESVPKLESKIKSLTAVNGKMGVSLTDSVGNFRSTYDILSDIADRWKEIQEADKKDGKNRANDLLETMANPGQYVQKCA